MLITLLNSPVVYDQNVTLVEGFFFQVMDSIQCLFPLKIYPKADFLIYKNRTDYCKKFRIRYSP